MEWCEFWQYMQRSDVSPTSKQETWNSLRLVEHLETLSKSVQLEVMDGCPPCVLLWLWPVHKKILRPGVYRELLDGLHKNKEDAETDDRLLEKNDFKKERGEFREWR